MQFSKMCSMGSAASNTESSRGVVSGTRISGKHGNSEAIAATDNVVDKKLGGRERSGQVADLGTSSTATYQSKC